MDDGGGLCVEGKLGCCSEREVEFGCVFGRELRGRLRRGEVEVQEGSAGVVRSVVADAGDLNLIGYAFISRHTTFFRFTITCTNSLSLS